MAAALRRSASGREIIGDTTPSPVPPPPPKNKCNAIAAIIIIIVVIIVTIYTAGAAGGAMASSGAGTGAGAGTAGAAGAGAAGSGTAAVTVGSTVSGGAGGLTVTATTTAASTMGTGSAILAGGVSGTTVVTGLTTGQMLTAAAIGGMAGAAAGQVAGKALGVRDHFSGREVLAGGLTAAFSAGVGSVVNSGFAAGAANYAGGQAASRIAGLDTQFSWAGLVGSSLSAGITSTTGSALGNAATNQTEGFFANVATGILGGAIHSTTTRLFGEGGKQQWGQIATDAFGNALASSLASELSSASSSVSKDRISALSPEGQKEYQELIASGAASSDAMALAESSERYRLTGSSFIDGEYYDKAGVRRSVVKAVTSNAQAELAAIQQGQYWLDLAQLAKVNYQNAVNSRDESTNNAYVDGIIRGHMSVINGASHQRLLHSMQQDYNMAKLVHSYTELRDAQRQSYGWTSRSDGNGWDILEGFLQRGVDTVAHTAQFIGNTLLYAGSGGYLEQYNPLNGDSYQSLFEWEDNYERIGSGLFDGVTMVAPLSPKVIPMSALGKFAKTQLSQLGSKANQLLHGMGEKFIDGLSASGRTLSPQAGMIDLTDIRLAATNNVDDVVGLRIQQLTAEGHGVQRHGAGVTQIQLEGRSVQGLDPMTGTRVDGVHGGTHQYAQHATKVVSDEAYVYAENYARNSQQFVDATAASTTGRAQLEIPLNDIYGADFREFVYGVTRYGPKNSPTGFGNTVFSDNAYMVVRYKQDATGNWLFNTMFPQPH